MTITSLTDTFSVSGQLCEQDLKDLCKNGVSTLINVRPDNEALEQKPSAQWVTLCEHYGVQYFHIPVISCQYSELDINQFKDALAGSHKKVHCFCRTGTRAAHLFALAKKDDFTFKQLHAILKDKGYDLDVISKHF